MYADDTSIHISGNDLQKLCCEIHSELEHFSEWLKANKCHSHYC